MSDPLDEAFAAYLRACDEGRIVSRDEFLGQYPAELASRLAELMRVADSLDAIVTAASDESSGDVPPASVGAEVAVIEPSTDAAGASDETVQWEPTGASAAAVGNGDNRDHDMSAGGGRPTKNLTLPTTRGSGRQGGPNLPYDLGDYTLLNVLGRGGMGVVYLAQQKGLGRQVAVKMIRSGMLATEAEVRRFVMEAQAAAALEHRNIVSVYQSGYLDGHYYFSMEYVPGIDLAKLIDQAPLAPRLAARYVRDVARAIHHAHLRGVLHRDLKPANVLITPDDEVRVTDFGLAKQTDTDSSVTGSGTAIGTPSYMAPEQASGYSDRVRVQSDVYSLGALLFAALTGRAPFGGESVMQTLMQVIHQPAPSIRSLIADLPEDLETIVAKCLEKSPEDRYRTAAELADELDAFLDERPIAARPRPPHIRLRDWLKQVPLVAALSGRRIVEPSPEHRRFQAAMLGLFILVPLMLAGAFSLRQYGATRVPKVVRIAGGLDGGMYDAFSRELGQRIGANLGVDVQVFPTAGSLENRDSVLAGDVHLAPMQFGALGSDELCIVAPLLFEAVHILVRRDSPIEHVDQIASHEIAVGPSSSGSRLATEMVLESLGLPPESAPRKIVPWPDLITVGNRTDNRADDGLPAVAIICIGKRSGLVEAMLAESGGWRLLPLGNAIEISVQHPTLRPMTIAAADYPAAGLPPAGISTVGTTAFLVSRLRAPDRLVMAALEAVYQPPTPIDGLIPRDRATEWQGLGFHPAAKRFFADEATAENRSKK